MYAVQPVSGEPQSYTPIWKGNSRSSDGILSATVGDEYSSKPTHPPGKWFYEQVLQCNLCNFEPVAGLLEVYQPMSPEVSWNSLMQTGVTGLRGIGLFLGVWQGTKAERTGYWLHAGG